MWRARAINKQAKSYSRAMIYRTLEKSLASSEGRGDSRKVLFSLVVE